MKLLTLKNFHKHLWKTYMSTGFSIPINLCPTHFGEIRDWCVPQKNKLYVFGAQIKSNIKNCWFCKNNGKKENIHVGNM